MSGWASSTGTGTTLPSGTGTATTSAGDITYNSTTDQFFVNDSFTDGQVLISDGTGITSWVTSGVGSIHIAFGPYTIEGLEGGDLSIVVDEADDHIEFIISKKKVRKFLEKIADIVIEGKEG